jgi:hypothetical protein
MVTAAGELFKADGEIMVRAAHGAGGRATGCGSSGGRLGAAAGPYAVRGIEAGGAGVQACEELQGEWQVHHVGQRGAGSSAGDKHRPPPGAATSIPAALLGGPAADAAQRELEAASAAREAAGAAAESAHEALSRFTVWLGSEVGGDDCWLAAARLPVCRASAFLLGMVWVCVCPWLSVWGEFGLHPLARALRL